MNTRSFTSKTWCLCHRHVHHLIRTGRTVNQVSIARLPVGGMLPRSRAGSATVWLQTADMVPVHSVKCVTAVLKLAVGVYVRCVKILISGHRHFTTCGFCIHTDPLLLPKMLRSFFLFRFPTVICTRFSSRWLKWNFNTVCRVVSICGRLLISVIWSKVKNYSHSKLCCSVHCAAAWEMDLKYLRWQNVFKHRIFSLETLQSSCHSGVTPLHFVGLCQSAHGH